MDPKTDSFAPDLRSREKVCKDRVGGEGDGDLLALAPNAILTPKSSLGIEQNGLNEKSSNTSW